ncbi:hypothetical protein ABBQ32_000798 [Trebouxia sp. C0010 RCD-2024]
MSPQSLAKSTHVPGLPPSPGATAAGVAAGPDGLDMGTVILMPAGVTTGAGDAAGDEGTVLVPGADGRVTPGVATGNPVGAFGEDPAGDSPLGVGGRGSGGEFVGTSEAWFPVNGGEVWLLPDAGVLLGEPGLGDALLGWGGVLGLVLPGLAGGVLVGAAGVPGVAAGLPGVVGGLAVGLPGVAGVLGGVCDVGEAEVLLGEGFPGEPVPGDALTGVAAIAPGPAAPGALVAAGVGEVGAGGVLRGAAGLPGVAGVVAAGLPGVAGVPGWVCVAGEPGVLPTAGDPAGTLGPGDGLVGGLVAAGAPGLALPGLAGGALVVAAGVIGLAAEVL